ncbi:hypothetical protein BH09MYX1_BH09MYX1_29180 [soil metagenome]
MAIASVSQGNPRGLPQALRAAQAAIRLPEVQAIIRRLSDYNLGVFMPHAHDGQSGDFEILPEDVVQVESGLEVSFQPASELESRMDRFLVVGWIWRSGASVPVAVCEMTSGEGAGDEELSTKHKMKRASG